MARRVRPLLAAALLGPLALAALTGCGGAPAAPAPPPAPRIATAAAPARTAAYLDLPR
ncbi:hypothetical protein ACWGNM_41580 [Streptomyces sp. NPDC055796]